MKLISLPIEDAVDGILIHNVADAEGHKALPKGHRLAASDIAKLRTLGKTAVFVGMLEAGDLTENDAATRIARAVAGDNLIPTTVTTGRINLLAAVRGVFRINNEALSRVNAIEGVTLATIPAHTVVEPKKMTATIKTIGLAVRESAVQEVERIGVARGAALSVRELRPARVAIILTGSSDARARVEKAFDPPITARVEELGSNVFRRAYVAHEPDAIAAAITASKAEGAECVILAGETSIMDSSDVTPTGILQAGGAIEVYGAPVEPGNLMLLAYLDAIPVIGAPGCVRSRDANVVDLILPRLLSGERVTRADVNALANGGLLI